MNENVLELKNIFIDYKLKRYDIRAVTDVNLNLKRGKITALVGESGSGKTTLASAILQCISEPGVLAGGEINFFGKEGEVLPVHKLSDIEMNKFRWEKASMVFQAAQSALNPVYTIYDQFYETVKAHNMPWTKAEFQIKMKNLIDYVKLDYERISNAYPHELSGGMKQRIMIAFSLLLHPQLIILDEPTTALDVITQDYIFKILKEINTEMGITMLLMTHDIGVVAKFADYVGVMYAGRLMEYGTVRQVFKDSRHPYTTGLIRATPSLISDFATVEPIDGNPPDLRNLPSGCTFAPRCSFCTKICERIEPETDYLADRQVKCHNCLRG